MIAAPPIVRTPGLLRARTQPWREGGGRIALVTVSGPYHEGCRRVFQAARDRADHVIAGRVAGPDAPEGDGLAEAARMIEAGGDLVYAPHPETIAESDLPTPAELHGGDPADAAMAAATTRMILQCSPDLVFIGAEHGRRIDLLRRLAGDLGLGVEVVAVPPVDEPDDVAV